MSARLVKVSDELTALADACDEPARADEPYRRALRVIHARLTATAARDPRPPARARTRPRHRRATRRRRVAGRPRRRRRVAARQRQRGAGRRPAGPAAGSGARLRFSPLAGWTCGRTPRCTRRSSPSCWPGRACIPTTRRCPSPTASRCWSPNWAPGDRWSATAPSCPSWPARNSTSCAPPRARCRCSGRTRCPTTSSRCASRCRTCSKRRCCSRRPDCSTRLGRAALQPGRHRAAVRDDRRPAARLGDHGSGA